MITGENQDGGANTEHEELVFNSSMNHLAMANVKQIASERSIIRPLKDNELTSDGDVHNESEHMLQKPEGGDPVRRKSHFI